MEKLNLLLLALMVMSHSALTDIVIQVQQKVGLGDSQPRDLEEDGGDTAMDDSEGITTTEGIMTTMEGITTTTEGITTTTKNPIYCYGLEIPSTILVGVKIFNCTVDSVEGAKEFCESRGSSLLPEAPKHVDKLNTFTKSKELDGFWINVTKEETTWSWANGDPLSPFLIVDPESDILYMKDGAVYLFYGQNSTDMTEHYVLCVD